MGRIYLIYELHRHFPSPTYLAVITFTTDIHLTKQSLNPKSISHIHEYDNNLISIKSISVWSCILRIFPLESLQILFAMQSIPPFLHYPPSSHSLNSTLISSQSINTQPIQIEPQVETPIQFNSTPIQPNQVKIKSRSIHTIHPNQLL